MTRLILLASSFMVPLLISRQGRDLKLFAAELAALSGLFFIVAVRPSCPRVASRDRLPLLAVSFSWLAVILLSGILSRSPSASDEAVRQSLVFLLFVLASVSLAPADVGRISSLLLASFVFVGGYAALQKAGFEPVADFRNWHPSERVFATFGNPDFLGAFTAMLLPLFLGRAAASAKYARVAWGAGAAWVALTLFWTLSRGAMLGALAGVSVWALLAFPAASIRRQLPKVASAVAALLLVLGLFGALPLESLARRTDRLMLWEGTLRMVRVKPLAGWGRGSFPAEYPPFAPAAFAARMKADNTFAEHPHCEYLHVAVEDGLIGLGIFLWLFAFIGRNALLLARRPGGPWPGVAGALAAIAVHIAVDRNFRLASTAVPFWLLCGAAIAATYASRKRGPAHAASVGRKIAAYLGLAAILLLATRVMRPLAAAIRVAQDKDFLSQPADVPLSVLETQRATRSGDPVFFLQLGTAYAKMSRFPNAAGAFAEALKLDPSSVSAANNLGNSYFMMSRFDDAISAYEMALALDPSHKDARFNMAYAYFHKRDLKRALAECDTLLRQDPTYFKAVQLKNQISP